MGRKSALRQKSGYWATHIGGKTKYFGRVSDVPYADAMRRFQDFQVVRDLEVVKEEAPAYALTVDALADLFLTWVQTNRGEKAHKERSRHIGRFQESCGTMPVMSIRGSHLEEFIATLQKAGHAPNYVQKHFISVRAMFNRGEK